MHAFPTLSPEEWDKFCRRVLPELAAFELVAATHSRKSVSEKLLKTPAGVGKSILRAERELSEWLNGGKLIDRSQTRFVETTEAGKEFVRFAGDVLERTEKFLHDLHHVQYGYDIRLASIYSSWMTYGRQIEVSFTKQVPDGSVNVEFFNDSDYINQIVLAVDSGHVDVGITSYPPPQRKVPRSLRIQNLVSQEMMLVFSSSYKRLPKGRKVDLVDAIRDDSSLRIIIYSPDIPANNKVLSYIKERRDDRGSHFRIRIENIAQIKEALSSLPSTASILPASAVRNEVAEGKLRAYSLDPPMEPWPWGLIYRAQSSRPAVRQFVKCFDGFLPKSR
jgi:DNA-binding transcriptional LysR family regulator